MATPQAAGSLALAPACAFLRARGLGEPVWARAGIGACARGPHAGRVVVPVVGPDRAWQGWVGRAWVKQAEEPYYYPPGMPRGELLYNEAALAAESDAPILVVEGVFDALALWPDGVAVFGSLSEDQFWVLAASRRPVVFALDGDAWVTGFALACRLRAVGQRAGSVRLPPLKDPDEVPLAWLQEEALAALE